MTRTIKPSATVALRKGYLLGKGADLANVDFTGADARGTRLFGDPLCRAGTSRLPTHRLHRYGPGFHLLPVRRANRTDSHLAGAIFADTPFSGTLFTNADLTGATFPGTDLSAATVSGTDFTGVTFTNVTATGLIGRPAALPAGWSIVGGTLIHTPCRTSAEKVSRPGARDLAA